jgi:hypothetical protein
MTSTNSSRPHLGVSSWSLHRTLGAPHFEPVLGLAPQAPAAGALDLLDLPAALRREGYDHLEICHFHIPDASPKYLQQLRGALESEGVSLWALLLDNGDITHPTQGGEWIEWNKKWIDISSTLGARHARIIAGKQEPTPENLERSRDALQVLADYAAPRNVRVLTENWFDLLPSSDEVLWLMGELDGAIGLKVDFNNWKAPHKYLHLPRIAHLAESSHTKCVFTAPLTPDKDDYTRCLDMLEDVGFSGQHTLIYDGEDADEWAHLNIEREIVKRYL